MKKLLSAVLSVTLLFGMSITVKATNIDLNELLGSLSEMTTNGVETELSMPDKYSITYEYAEYGKFQEVTLEKDEMNNYHYKDSEDEFLFVSDGNGFRLAISTVNGFVYKNEDKYTFDYVKEQTAKFWNYVDPFEDDIPLGTTTEEGEGEICGRKTKKYKAEMGFGYSMGGYSMSMSDATYYELDEETGICMASSSSADYNVMGLSTSDEDLNEFECIRFELEDVVLPTVE